jgi:hypothetical protein
MLRMVWIVDEQEGKSAFSGESFELGHFVRVVVMKV